MAKQPKGPKGLARTMKKGNGKFTQPSRPGSKVPKAAQPKAFSPGKKRESTNPTSGGKKRPF